jgi:hypothetical protein
MYDNENERWPMWVVIIVAVAGGIQLLGTALVLVVSIVAILQ